MNPTRNQTYRQGLLCACLFAARFSLATATILAAGGCYGDAKYSWGFANATTEQITGVNLLDPDHPARRWGGAGDLPNRATGQDFAGYYPMPKFGLLVWRDEYGTNQKQIIAISSELRDPDDFDGGILWFVYIGHKFRLFPMTKEQVLWQAIHVPANYPSIGYPDPIAPHWIYDEPMTPPATRPFEDETRRTR